MFGRKIPTIQEKPAEKPATTTESNRTTSYRMGQDTAPPTVGAPKTTSYVNPLQQNTRGYETIN
jgi:hypothetical protein